MPANFLWITLGSVDAADVHSPDLVQVVTHGAQCVGRVQIKKARPAADRQAILDILRDTKPGLPEYFKN